jgi:hypothetical protein
MARARYAADQRIVDAGELFERFVTEENDLGGVLQAYQGWSKRLTISATEEAIWRLRHLETQGEAETKLILTDMHFRPSPGLGLPQGLHVIFATGESLDDASELSEGVVLKWEPLRWPFDLPYYDDCVEIENAQYYFGDTYTRLTGGLNKGLNEMLLYQTMAAARAGKTVSFIAGHDSVNDKFNVTHPTDDDTIIASTNPQARMSSSSPSKLCRNPTPAMQGSPRPRGGSTSATTSIPISNTSPPRSPPSMPAMATTNP